VLSVSHNTPELRVNVQVAQLSQRNRAAGCHFWVGGGWPLFGVLAHWKACSGLPISDNGTFFSLGAMVQALQANINWKSPFLKGVGNFRRKFHVEGDVSL